MVTGMSTGNGTGQAPARLSNDFYLRVYVSFEGLFQVPHELFEKIESWASTDARCAVTGIIHFSKLLNTGWWKRAGASLIVLPDGIVEHGATEFTNAERHAGVEFA